MNAFRQWRAWQYWVHLVIIVFALVVVDGLLMSFIKGWPVFLVYVVTFLVSLFVLGVFDPLAHQIMSLFGWRD